MSRDTSPDWKSKHLFLSASSAKRPWHPFGRGLRMILGKRMNKEYALKDNEEFLWSERARERMMSKVSRIKIEASFGKTLLFTGTLKSEISFRSHSSSPPGEHNMISRRS